MIPLEIHREARLIASKRSADGAAEAQRRSDYPVNKRAQRPHGHTPPQASWLATLLGRVPQARVSV